MSTAAAGARPEAADPGRNGPRAGALSLAVRLVPCALLVCLWLILIPPSGGYFPRSWYPVALASVLLFYVLRLATRAEIAPSRPLRVALALFAAVVVWAFLSITWAPSSGSA